MWHFKNMQVKQGFSAGFLTILTYATLECKPFTHKHRALLVETGPQLAQRQSDQFEW